MSEQARLRARDPECSALVQAPAGSGKTELLTQRILALLSRVDEPEEILALTFTRKAAAEMRTRLVEALNMPEPAAEQAHKRETWLLAQAALRRSDVRGWNLAGHASRLRMMTLDSFMHMLASRLPLLSGLGEMPVAGEDTSMACRLAAEAALELLLKSDRETAESLLLHFDHQAVTLIELVAKMLEKREQWLPVVAAHARDMSGLRRILEGVLASLLEEQLQACHGLMPIEFRHALPGLLAYAGEQRKEAELAALTAWPKAVGEAMPLWLMIADELTTRDGLRKPGGINVKRGFPSGKEGADQKQQFQQILAELALIPGCEAAWLGLKKLPLLPNYSDAQWQQMESLFSLLILAAGELQRQFATTGEADFTEIALRALQALEGDDGTPSDLLLRLDYRIHHILVDEFQDTSLLQMRLLQNLTAGWQSADGRHRTLFMVGDPMQSIYRFRKAEVGLFLQAAANAAGLPIIEFLQLERNFRSSPAIVDWVNRAFAAIFPDRQDAVRGAVRHAQAKAALSHAGSVQLHLQHLSDTQTQVDDALEAAAIVELIRAEQQRLHHDGRMHSIAILARSRKQLHAIMPALSDAGIAFRATKLLPLHTRPEIRLFRALLRALLHTGDRESWAALLRSPFGGLGSRDLLQLLGGSDTPVWQLLQEPERLQGMSEDGYMRSMALVAALQPCMQQAGRMPLRDLLNTAWHRLGLHRFFSAESVDNIAVALELLAELDEGGRLDFARFDERLEKLFAAADTSPEAAGVELMTMHGAKGLQWDVVILPGLGKRGNSSDAPLLALTDIPVAGREQPLLAMRAPTRGEDALFSLVSGIEKSKYDYELARLLYVACTRPETTLHMFGHVSKQGQAAAGTLLSLLLPGGIDGGCFGAEVVLLNRDENAAECLNQAVQDKGKCLERMQELPLIADVAELSGPAERAYVWAGPEAAPVGNAVHAMLQRIGELGIEGLQYDAAMLPQELKLRLRRSLQAEGLAGALLVSAEKRAEKALLRTLASERGRWILSGKHREAHCEWAISSAEEGRVLHHVIDRSFIDAQGVRWIVDYKTASHEGGDLAAFLAEEESRHAGQLQRYASILARLDPDIQIRTALYFPMLDAWREVTTLG